MPILLPHESTNPKVSTLQGIHLYHSKNSFCSRQVRLALAIKRIEYISHELDIEHKKENIAKHYLGINPRGLVPTLVHNGKVIIETIDILKYVDSMKNNDKTTVRLIPGPDHDTIVQLVERIDTLHQYIQTIALCRLPRSMQKSTARNSHKGITAITTQWQDRTKEKTTKSMTIGGILETKANGQSLQKRYTFWRQLSTRDFREKEKATAYSLLFDEFLKFETTLENTDYLLGNKSNDVLTLVDVTWWVVIGRFLNVLRDVKKEQFRQHVPKLWKWHERLSSRIEFKAEIEEDTFLMKMMVGYKRTTDVSNATAFAVFCVGLTMLYMLIKYENGM